MRYRKTLTLLEEDLQTIDKKYLYEGKDHDEDGDNDFADVMMQRMKKSGMDHEEALKKTRKHNKNENSQEAVLDEKKRDKQKASDIPGYAKGRSKKALKKLNKETGKASKGKYTSADYEREDKRRQKELPKGSKTPKNPFTGKIGVSESMERDKLRSLLEDIISKELEEKKKRKKKAKKKTLSKKTMATLRKKAKSSGYTAGSLAAEYRKGLGAYYTSGSRKGMGSHQWAMARVNSAIGKGNPSWANLKRSKAKKK
jgi:hypothetical protein